MRAKTLEVESDRIIMIDNESCSLGKGKVRYASDSFSGHKTASLMRIYMGTLQSYNSSDMGGGECTQDRLIEEGSFSHNGSSESQSLQTPF